MIRYKVYIIHDRRYCAEAFELYYPNDYIVNLFHSHLFKALTTNICEEQKYSLMGFTYCITCKLNIPIETPKGEENE